MSKTILKVENISKQYRLGLVGTGTLSHDLNRFWHRIRGKEDPYLKIGVENDRSKKATQDYVWALRDINFEVKEGEVLGIIGKNGAGKSTLLKILSRVTSPTTGVIKTGGRIASLLEVGTGFHPELTGRENIFLNGAILGMTKGEIRAKLDEIIDFSGCEMYIDTPVKRYSSGMRVRLAFAVAAHLEPDILVVDEVLAVGDAEFQKKAIGKMQDISKGEGRTVLFVSHNMAAVKNLCTRGIVLERGKVVFSGDTENTINHYLNLTININTFEQIENSRIKIDKISLLNNLKKETNIALLGNSMSIKIDLFSHKKINSMVVKLTINNGFDDTLFILNNFHKNQVFNMNTGLNSILCKIDKLPLFAGEYTMDVELIDLQNRAQVLKKETCFKFTVEDGDYFNTGIIPRTKKRGYFVVEHQWERL